MLLWRWSEKGIDIKLPFLDRQKIGIEKGNYQRKPIQILILSKCSWELKKKKNYVFLYFILYFRTLFISKTEGRPKLVKEKITI